MKLNWTGWLTLTIVSAPFVSSGQSGVDPEKKSSARVAVEVKIKDPGSETSLQLKLKTAEEEIDALRKKLIEILEINEKQAKDYKKLKLKVAELVAGRSLKDQQINNVNLIEPLKQVVNAGQKLVLQSINTCRYLESELDKAPIGEVEKIRLKYKISELNSSSENFGLLIFPESEQTIKSLRVLSINSDLKVVVLSAGYHSGIRNGFILYVGDKKEITLRVVTVRPFISAATLTKGKYEEITPGMKVFLSK